MAVESGRFVAVDQTGCRRVGASDGERDGFSVDGYVLELEAGYFGQKCHGELLR
jgi:hypothetical protein